MREAEALRAHPNAVASFPAAQALYAKAVDFAQWLGLPLWTIHCQHQGWYWPSLNGYWTWYSQRADDPESLALHVWFVFETSDEAKEYGFAYGRLITSEGAIGPYKETPEGLAKQEEQARNAWKYLEEATTPTPLHERPKAERKAVAKFAMQRQEKAQAVAPKLFTF